MDIKKFKLTLESSLGKRLDNLKKEFDVYRAQLNKARNLLRDINLFIESKNGNRRYSVPARPLTRLSKTPIIIQPKAARASTLTRNKQISSDDNHGIANKSLNLIEKLAIQPRVQHKTILRLSFDQIKSQLHELESHYSSETLNAKMDYSASLGAISAFDIIKGMTKDHFIIPSNSPKFLWAIGLVFQLFGEDFNSESNTSLTRAQQFLSLFSEDQSTCNTFNDIAKGFNFSDKNIDAIEEYIWEKDELLNPQSYSQVSQLCGLLMVCLREAVTFCGLIKGKSPIWKVYHRLLYKKGLLE